MNHQPAAMITELEHKSSFKYVPESTNSFTMNILSYMPEITSLEIPGLNNKNVKTSNNKNKK
jgi:hypothetical protein